MILRDKQNNELQPFLKWAGGKRWLVKSGLKITPPKFNRYIEPFLGGAAVFFSLQETNKYILSDINPELINCYEAIRLDYSKIEKLLSSHQEKHSDDYYYKVRESEPENNFTKAAKFLYLNRACWNGLYRVNRQGKFNVPKGTKSKIILDTDNFGEVAERLKNGEILCQDFESTLSLAAKGDFVFVDPPYTVNHNLNGFLKYNENIFSWEDQKRLKNAVVAAADRGAMITMTNADHKSIHELYSGLCTIECIERSSVISGNAKYRGLTTEAIIRIGWN